MRIKIQERDMLASEKKINSEIAKLEHIQKELQSMLNSTNWDMRAKRSMEVQLEDARKLNKDLILITKNMSYSIKNTTNSMKERDLQLSKYINDNSITIYNGNSNNESNNSGFDIFGVSTDFDLFEDIKNGKPVIDIGAEGSIISWDKDVNFGSSIIGGSAGIDLDGGNVVVNGGASVDLDSGDFGAKGEVGVYAGKGKIDGTINLGPFEISGSAGVSWGAGIGGNLGFEDGKFGIGGSISCGPGVSAGISIGFNPEWFKK